MNLTNTTYTPERVDLLLDEALDYVNHMIIKEVYYDDRSKLYVSLYSDSNRPSYEPGDIVVEVQHTQPSGGFVSATLIQ